MEIQQFSSSNGNKKTFGTTKPSMETTKTGLPTGIQMLNQDSVNDYNVPIDGGRTPLRKNYKYDRTRPDYEGRPSTCFRSIGRENG